MLHARKLRLGRQRVVHEGERALIRHRRNRKRSSAVGQKVPNQRFRHSARVQRAAQLPSPQFHNAGANKFFHNVRFLRLHLRRSDLRSDGGLFLAQEQTHGISFRV